MADLGPCVLASRPQLRDQPLEARLVHQRPGQHRHHVHQVEMLRAGPGEGDRDVHLQHPSRLQPDRQAQPSGGLGRQQVRFQPWRFRRRGGGFLRRRDCPGRIVVEAERVVATGLAVVGAPGGILQQPPQQQGRQNQGAEGDGACGGGDDQGLHRIGPPPRR